MNRSRSMSFITCSNVGPHVLHRVVDRHACVRRPARGVDVERDVLVWVFGLEEEQLGGDHVRDPVLNLLAEEDDALAEQARVDVERAFVAAVLLHDHRYQRHREPPVKCNLLVAPLYATQRLRIGGAVEVTREIVFPVPPDEVWEALTDPEQLEEWFANDVELDATEGGEGIFRWNNGEERHATVVEATAQRETATATELAAELPVTRQAVAKHLAALNDAGLVESRREGRETRYELTPGPLAAAMDWIAGVGAEWDSRLARLRRHLSGGSPRRAGGARRRG